MGRKEIVNTFSLLVEIEGHFTHEFVSYVCETEDWRNSGLVKNLMVECEMR
jgi:hypothetical protein